ncbi:MAG: phage BR0599 family protein [Burkholderiales bacterium]|nr:phage BR0599 family protein [Burkholderiales bacterium]
MSLPRNNVYHMVLFEFAQGREERFTDWTAEVEDGSANTYAPCPTMSIKFPANTGVREEKPVTIEMPVEASTLFEALTGHEPMGPCYVTVKRAVLPLPDDSGSEQVVDVCVRYRVRKATKRPGGKRGIVKIEALGPKATLPVLLGLAATPECQWTLFGRGCGVAQIESLGTLDSIDEDDLKKVTITGLDDAASLAPGDTPGDFWTRGYVTSNVGIHAGARIPIRMWSASDPTTFYLARKPPAEWVGETVVVVPGCDKLYATCVGRYNNAGNFAGAGVAIPARHPTYESE